MIMPHFPVGVGLLVAGLTAWSMNMFEGSTSSPMSKDAIEEILRTEEYRTQLADLGKELYFDSLSEVSREGRNQGINVQTVYEKVIENGMEVTRFDVQVTWLQRDGSEFTRVIPLEIKRPVAAEEPDTQE